MGMAVESQLFFTILIYFIVLDRERLSGPRRLSSINRFACFEGDFRNWKGGAIPSFGGIVYNLPFGYNLPPEFNMTRSASLA